MADDRLPTAAELRAAGKSHRGMGFDNTTYKGGRGDVLGVQAGMDARRLGFRSDGIFSVRENAAVLTQRRQQKAQSGSMIMTVSDDYGNVLKSTPWNHGGRVGVTNESGQIRLVDEVLLREIAVEKAEVAAATEQALLYFTQGEQSARMLMGWSKEKLDKICAKAFDGKTTIKAPNGMEYPESLRGVSCNPDEFDFYTGVALQQAVAKVRWIFQAFGLPALEAPSGPSLSEMGHRNVGGRTEGAVGEDFARELNAGGAA